MYLALILIKQQVFSHQIALSLSLMGRLADFLFKKNPVNWDVVTNASGLNRKGLTTSQSPPKYAELNLHLDV